MPKQNILRALTMSVLYSVLLAPTLTAKPLAPDEAPEPLKPWIEWVLWDQDKVLCPFLDGNESGKACAWPSTLTLSLNETDGVFSQSWRLYADGWVPLPGDEDRWPLDVRVDGQPGAVVFFEDAPRVYLKKGEHAIQGRFAWDSLPESFPIPAETGALRLSVKGAEVARPNLTEDGLIWLQAGSREEEAEDSLDVRIHRRIDDDIPLTLTTSIALDVSGKTRETVFAPLLPEGFVPMALESPLPARLQPDGRLKVQIRSGQWKISLQARHQGPVSEIILPKDELAPEEEIWVFVPHNDLRLVTVEGVAPVDPQQTTLPDEWKRLAAYRVRRGDTVRLVEQRRGDAEGTPDQLTLNRQIWLDFNGRGTTFQDRIGGTFSRDARLEMNSPMDLGRISIDGQDQLITKAPGREGAGIEIRRGPAELSADSRLEGRRFTLPAIGWNRDFQYVSGTLHLPPGWRAFAVWGADHVPNTWLNRWSLLDIFLVLVLAISFAKIWSKTWGLVALVAFTLTFPEYDAPLWVWLAVVIGEALTRLLPESAGGGFKTKIRIPLKLYRIGTLVILLLIAIPFSVFSLRQALYPSLEPVQGLIQAPAAAFKSKAEVPPPPPRMAPAPAGGAYDLAEEEAGLALIEPQAQMAPNQGAPQKKMKAPLFRESRKLVSQNLQQAPGAQVQTGPGLPRWTWHSVPLQWSGPVAKDQTLRLVLLGPCSNFLLAVLRVLLLMLLILRVLDFPGKFWPNFMKKHLIAGLVAVFVLAVPAGKARADFPSPDLLNQLRERLLQKPECAPNCASISRLRVEATPALLRLRLEIAAQAPTAAPLPANPKDWMPRQVSVDGGRFAGVRSGDGQVWIDLTPGAHQVVIEGPLSDRPSIQIPLPLKPHRVEAALQGWTLEGLHEDGLADDNLELTRTQPLSSSQESASVTSNNLPPFVRIERRLSLGLTWSVETTIERLTPPGSSVVIEVPLLAGESVTSDGIRVRDGKVSVSLPPQESEFSWSSVLQPADAIELKAPDQGNWVELWTLEASPIWHLDSEGAKGIPQIPAAEEGVLQWRPWPGEQVALKITRPEGVPGRTVTIDHSLLSLAPGLRFTEATLALDIRSSLGGQHAVSLPEGVELQSVSVNGDIQPIRAIEGKVTLPLAPGSQNFSIKWQQPNGVRSFFRAPAIDLGVPSVNADLHVSFPERWVLFVGGPRLGPAILFWSLLIVMVLIAVGLARTELTPLTTLRWIILSLGLTQTPVWASLIFVGWFLAMGWREKRPVAGPWTFNFLQIALVVWTVMAIGILFVSIHQGLLGSPDMQIAGNGSSASFLKWFQDRTAGPLPRPWVISLPMFCYRIAMLGWALWVAWAFISWLKWGWRAFTKEGAWKSAPLVRKSS